MRGSSGRLLRRSIQVVLGLLLAVGVAAAIVWRAAAPPAPDAFYTWDGPAPEQPGLLLRSQTFDMNLPNGARGWRLLYATTRGDGSPAFASALLLEPTAPGAHPRPIITWAHGTTGLAPGCAPSLAKPFANVPALQEAIDAGWAYVATDYVGLGAPGTHAYLVGDDAARAILDAIRAARQIPDLALDNNVVVWGHSQGGHAALWTGQRARTYAPDVNIAGVAALAPASDLQPLVAASQRSLFGRIVSAYLLEAYSAAYPDVAAGGYLDASTAPLARDIAGRCVVGLGTLVSAAEAWLLPSAGIFAREPTVGPLAARLAENTPAEPIAAPIMIAQGESDDLVLPEIQKAYIEKRCRAGQVIDYRTYVDRDHISLVAAGSPLVSDLLAWSRDRFEGKPALARCRE